MPMLSLITLLAVAFPAASGVQPEQVPQGWFKAGNAPNEYEVGTDDSERRSGSASAYVKARVASPKGFGTLMQTFAADEFRGKRVRLTGYLKANRAREAGLWLRIDGVNARSGRLPLAFDNTQSRVRPGQEWTRADIVVDVPSDAATINFGLLLAGEGQVWVDDLDLSIVGTDVPVTGGGPPRLPNAPRNLDFEKRKPPAQTSDPR